MIQHHCFSDNRAVRRRVKRGGSLQGECQRKRQRRAMQGEGEAMGGALRMMGGRRGEERDGKREEKEL